MRYFITLALFAFATIALGQDNVTTKISDAEKKRLENEFKALGSFYIDDSGVVVYQAQPKVRENTESHNQDKDKEESVDEKSNVQESVETTPVKEKKNDTKPISVTNNVTKTDVLPIINHNNIDSTQVVKQSTNAVKNNSTDKPQLVQSTKASNNVKQTNKVSLSTKASLNKKKSILNQRRESQYKSMEEAALAVEALLEELKKEERKTTSSGSMSTKLSMGVNKSLRKKISTVEPTISEPKQEQEEVSDKFGIEPSYFINGEEVTKTAVAKLNKKDIIRREIRVRNTVTGNPNGEIWYEVKTY